MIRTSILTAALLSATALVTVPAAAYTVDGDQGRQSRNWTGNQNDSNMPYANTRRGTAPNQRAATTTPRSTPVVVTPPRATTPPVIAQRDRDGDDDDYGARGHKHHAPAPAPRVREAYDDDHDGRRSYHSEGRHGDWQPPQRRRHHWYRRWW
jgi:hypothetical protein